MKNKLFIQLNPIKIWPLFSILAVIFFLIHIATEKTFINYSPLSQVIDGIDGIASEQYIPQTTLYTKLYGCFASLFSVFLYLHFRKRANGILKEACLLFMLMHLISFIGLGLLVTPTSGFSTTVHEFIHMCLTGIVVTLTIFSLGLFYLSFRQVKKWRWMAYLSLLAFIVIMIGTIMTLFLPITGLGVTESLNIYDVVSYTGLLGLFTIHSWISSNETAEQVSTSD